MMDFPPGYRFYPTEEELVSFYLHNKLEGRREDLNLVMDRVIPVVYIYEYNPWELPQFSGEACPGDPEQWFFFIPRQESEARGGRPRRLTTTGYWKATGSPSYVRSSSDNRAIGLRRTMVFYNGRAPHGKKTEWKMHEYKAIEAHADHNHPSMASSSNASSSSAPTLRQEFSLCRVYKKSKCLRAFDRRPPGFGIISSSRNRTLNIQAAPAHHHADQEYLQGSTSNRNPPINLMVERSTNLSSSSGSSSSGDDGPRPSAESGTLSMAVDHETVWDLQQLIDDWL